MAEIVKKLKDLHLSKTKNVKKMRKRLSMAEAKGASPLLLDGTSTDKKSSLSSESYTSQQLGNVSSKSKLFKSYSMKTKVGAVPFNPNKVNQDRAVIVPILPHSNNNAALFGVFDGHGMHGEDVSSYLLRKTPEWFQNNKNWKNDPKRSLNDCFAWLTQSLGKSNVNCTFSGTTAVTVCMDKKYLYTANVGDSRAILCRMEQGKLKAISLSIDQKPDDQHERVRIEKKNGRIQPCQGPMGEFIGPHRVWLKHQDIPGLAMSRSFGDDVATSVGVHSEPEIIKTERTKNDKFIVVASDGVWEFLSNEDVVDIVSKYDDVTKATAALVKQSTQKWKMEEDVIDDITAIIVYL